MGWGALFKAVYSVAPPSAKAAYDIYKAAPFLAKAAVATKDAVVARAVAAKDAAVWAYGETKDAVVAAAVATKVAAVEAYKTTKDAVVAGANAASQAVDKAAADVSNAAFKAREKQAMAAYGHGKASLGENSAGSPSQPCPYKVAECAELAKALEMAHLADDTYNLTPSDPVPGSNGFKRLDPDNPADAKILKEFLGTQDPKAMLEPEKSDFRARVYVRGSGANAEYVVGYRGTQTGKDWRQNGKQGAGAHSQHYEKAMMISDAASAYAKDKKVALTFTGHSLGGGMASAASVATPPPHYPAYTFNAAGLHANTVGGFPSPPAPVSAYFSPTDILNTVQDNRELALAGIVKGVASFGPIGKALSLPLSAWLGTNEVSGTPVLPRAYGTRKPLPLPDDPNAIPDVWKPTLNPLAMLKNAGQAVKDGHNMGPVKAGIETKRRQLGCQ